MDTEKILEFDKVKEKLMDLACTDRAKEEIIKLTPCLRETEVKAKLRETSEAKELLLKCGTPPLTALQGIEELVRAASKGGCLTPDELERIAMNLTAVRRLKDYLERGKQFGIGLSYFGDNLNPLPEIYREITEKIRNGRVDDYASKRLRDLRTEIERTEVKMHEKAETVLRTQKACLSDSFCTTRNGHLCVPVKKEYRQKVPGSVIEKSATGNTVFVEPEAVGILFGELTELKVDEENEERRILFTLSAGLSDKEEVMKENHRTIERLDFMFAKAKLSMEYGGTEPVIGTDRKIKIRKGRHPLMDQKINIPLDFEIGDGVNGVVITGPNTGGKTVAIKTVGLNCMMAQCGLHVPCEEARICMNDAFLCDIGDGQNLSENLSTFSAHITNVLDILKRVTRESLVIMDELGSGTDPAEGMGIAIAILEELKKSKALFLVTTHYPEVKDFARGEKEIVNARMTFDKESLKPLYQLIIGEAGESCAFYIAGKLGMPGEMLNRAYRAAYGSDKGADWVNAVGRQELEKLSQPKIQKRKQTVRQEEALKYHIGDSVMLLPDKKIGIVCQTANEKGVLRIQLPDKKIWVNHKRIRLHVPAEQLYPEDYDFSILFDSVENRKLRHDMERKYVEDTLICE